MAWNVQNFKGAVVFDELEMKWVEQALTLKITTERNKLDFLKDTIDISEDYDWHQAQTKYQQKVLAAHERLLHKVKEFSNTRKTG